MADDTKKYETVERWVTDPDTNLLKAVRFIYTGDIQMAKKLNHMALGVLRAMRQENVNRLKQYSKSTAFTLHTPNSGPIEDGSPAKSRFFTVVASVNHGIEEVIVTVPPPLEVVAPIVEAGTPPPVGSIKIIPAFEALDVDGNFVGVVLCNSETWQPTYELIKVDDFSVELSAFHPFGYENWRAGKTDSPTDPAPWSMSVRPYVGTLEDLEFYNTAGRRLTALASKGENLINQADTQQVGNVGDYDRYWNETGGRPSYNRFILDGFFWVNMYCTLCPTGLLDPGPSPVWWSSVFTRAIAGYESLTTCIENYDAEMVNIVTSGVLGSDLVINMNCGTGTPIVWTFIGTYTLPAGTTVLGNYDISQTIIGDELEYLNKWSTQTLTPNTGLLWGVEHVSTTYYFPDVSVLPPITTQNPSFNEYVIIDGVQYATVSAPGPYGIGSPVNVPQTTRGVYPRYYTTEDYGNFFLISIHRNPMNPDVYGVEPDTAPEQWQYGIYRTEQSTTGWSGWLFNTSFAVSNTDGSGSGPYGGHLIPDVTYNEGPVYCLGTFRLVKDEVGAIT